MQSDKEIQNFQHKIKQQEQILQKYKIEQQKLNNYIKQFKQAINKKTSLTGPDNDKKNNQQGDKLQAQLEKQIESANQMLKNYQNQLKNIEKKNNKVKNQDLTFLQQNLREKENEVKKLKQEIKKIQFIKRKQEKVIEKKNRNQDGGKLTRFIDEVRKNKQILGSMREKNKVKKQGLEKKKQTLKVLQEKYIKSCEQKGEVPITFQNFKDRVKEKRKEQMSSSKPKMKKPQPTVKQIINSQPDFGNIQYSQKGLKEMKTKRQVVEVSLKNAHKRYEKEIQQLSKKLETLQKENESLTTRLMQKTKQKQIATIGLSDGPKMSATMVANKTARKLTPLK